MSVPRTIGHFNNYVYIDTVLVGWKTVQEEDSWKMYELWP